jgi:hypothetical protein
VILSNNAWSSHGVGVGLGLGLGDELVDGFAALPAGIVTGPKLGPGENEGPGAMLAPGGIGGAEGIPTGSNFGPCANTDVAKIIATESEIAAISLCTVDIALKRTSLKLVGQVPTVAR